MNFNNFTIKAQEAIQKASEITSGNQQQAIEPSHILKALLLVDENVVSYLLKKLNVNIPHLSESLDKQIESFPKVSGSSIYLSSSSNSVIQKAQTYLKEFKDEFVSVEHLLLGILNEGDKRSEEHTSELQSRENLVCRLLLEKKKKNKQQNNHRKKKT